MSAPDPDELLRQLDPGIAELKAKAVQAQERISSSNATRHSQDGSVSVTVGPGGNLTGLTLTERAYQRPPAQLAAQIMRLSAQAQQQVSADIMAAFTGLVGRDSPALDVLSPFLPPEPDEQDDQWAGQSPAQAAQQAPPPAAPPQPPQPQRQVRRRRAPGPDVEPDYDEGDFLN